MRKWIVSVAAALSVSLLPGSVFAQDTPLPPVGWAPEGSPVAKYGQLKVVGAQVQSEKTNAAVQLRGMSFGWTSDITAESMPRAYYNERVVAWLAADWRVSLVRAAMGVSDKDGPNQAPGQPYKGSENTHKNIVKTLVNAAIWQGIYVIIDWHSHNATGELNEARPFFREMAGIYKDYPNVIYEIYNEPINDGWDAIKTYANSVISEIRAVDPKNLIIVGTPQYSSQIGQAASSPLSATNIAYAMHFYCDHGEGYIPFTNTTTIPIFASEFGISKSSGDGTCSQYNNGDGYGETDTWLDKLDARKVSWANWQVNNRNESSSILKMPGPGADISRLHKGKWTDNDLSDRGKWIRSRLRDYDNGANLPNRTYKVSVKADGDGTVSGGSNIAVCSEATLTANPGTGSRFEGWILSGATSASNPYKLEVCYDREGTAVFFPNNLISASTFTANATGWARSPNSANGPDMATVNGELVVNMPSSVGTNPADRFVYHSKTSLTNGKKYKLTFDARATQARTMQVAYCADDGWGGIAHKINIGAPVSLTTTMRKNIELEFNMTDPTTTAGVIAFYLGGNSAGVTLDNVKLLDVGQGTSVAPQAGAAYGRTSWSVAQAGGALHLRGPAEAGARVSLYDTRGKMVKSAAAQDGMTFGVGVPAGNYLVVVKNRAGSEVMKSRVSLVK